jgi:glycosyltransferase involved in cell wall biosynthesis
VAFSVLVLTLDEEGNLPGCLESVSWSDDVVVLDSFSSDRTVEIARASGARGYRRAFDDFAGQRNYAIDEIPFSHDWVFQLDADERFTPELRRECEDVIARDEKSGYLVPSRMMFRGRWLRWSGLYPSYQMRLMKLGEIRFVQKGHGQREAEALRGVGRLREPYLHYSFSKGLGEWTGRHRRYAREEAEEVLRSSVSLWRIARGVFSFDPVRRRRALKELSFRLPARPPLRFTYMYFLRLGLLDGWPGFRYCRLMARYERMIVENLRLLRAESAARGRRAQRPAGPGPNGMTG